MSRFSQSRFAARLQEKVSQRRKEAGLYAEITGELALPETGRVLDVGTGTGLQLRAIHDARPELGLCGLDLSGEAIRIAHTYLQDLDVDLRQGSIETAPFDDDFFDLVTCHSSMSYWPNLGECFDEIYRILKPGGRAVLFEPQKEIDMDKVVQIINRNLADKSPLRRFAASRVNKYGLRWGRAVGLKLYSVAELEEIAAQSRFAGQATVERTTLQNLPIFVRITLVKVPWSPPRASPLCPSQGPLQAEHQYPHS